MRGKLFMIGAFCTALSVSSAQASPLPSGAAATTFVTIDTPNTLSELPKTKQFLEGLLDKFCQAYYYKCFKGREYAEGSVSVESIKVISEWEVEVEGRHTYLGRLGHEYRKRPFRATILKHKGTDDTYTITFEKQSENYLTNSTYWEDTTQVFRCKNEN